ncbi:hypothetical protein ACFFLM_08300 [Deinococcus oregonensis]|uniref:Uncharacterized protein n=1 Tax=Deinococcus oregonensis TaxID=1805970 RepID=A0ABV6AWS3_9DEIO
MTVDRVPHPDAPPREWWGERLSDEQIAQRHTVTAPDFAGSYRLFGFLHEQWLAFIVQRQAGDEVWDYCSDFPSWQVFRGVMGLVLVRAGVPIAWMVTTRN